MGLVILCAVGGILGWLSSIILAVQVQRAVMLYVGAGMTGSVITGQLTTPSSLIDAISPVCVLTGTVGAITFLTVVHFIRERMPSNF